MIKRTRKGKLRILVTHRPRYDDWSLPKGKADPKEKPEDTAVREVLEETGFHCRIIAPLGKTRYQVSDRTKEVAWFAMRPLPDSRGFRPNAEVDAVRWLSRKKAAALLDYERDWNLVMETDLKKLSRTGTLFLLRHAVAGDRSKWSAEDRHRPLTKLGHRQARAIADRLEGRGIERIISSPYDRCTQTVDPLSRGTRARVETSDAISEDADLDDSWRLLKALVGQNAVLCTHGDEIAGLMKRLVNSGLSVDSRLYYSKGSIWEVEVDGGKFTTGTYFPPPGK